MIFPASPVRLQMEVEVEVEVEVEEVDEEEGVPSLYEVLLLLLLLLRPLLARGQQQLVLTLVCS